MTLGYACINLTLSDLKPKVTTNRSMVKRTFLNKGLDYASQLSLLNCQDLIKILKWNIENKIKLFRLSSEFFPWASEYKLRDLKDYNKIKTVLLEVGLFAKNIQ